MSDTKTGSTAAATRVGRPWFEWAVLSWTFALAVFRKGTLEGADRTKVIVQMNRLYIIASTMLFVIITAASCNRIGSMQWGPTNSGNPFRLATFVLASYCLSRCIEVFYAFYRDAFDKLGRVKPDSDLRGRQRIGLALASYAELILDFAILYLIVPNEAWQSVNANRPQAVTDALFYSASAITTSGGGGFVPKGSVLQALTAFEIACGLILLVVCFAVYAAGISADRDDLRLRDGLQSDE